jgi:hypothetical protein
MDVPDPMAYGIAPIKYIDRALLEAQWDMLHEPQAKARDSLNAVATAQFLFPITPRLTILTRVGPVRCSTHLVSAPLYGRPKAAQAHRRPI